MVLTILEENGLRSEVLGSKSTLTSAGVGTGPPNKPQCTSQPVFHLQSSPRSGLGGWGVGGAGTRKLLAAVTSLVRSWT